MGGFFKFLVVSFIAVCLVVMLILLLGGASVIRDYGSQGAPTYSWGQPVPRDNPFYQLPVDMRLLPAAIAGLIIIAVTLGNAGPR